MVATSHKRAVSASAVALLTLAALGLRVLWLEWQPLWWDEGYSVYFATESMSQMVKLTANDIHPPLYYGLLHGWLALLNRPDPVALRLFSVVVGVLAIPMMAWLAASLFAERPRTVALATFLLTFSPIHIFYSQEIRMYGLALVLGITATALFWKLVTRPTLSRIFAYAVIAALGLYTLYYFSFLLLAHALWGLWMVRNERRRLQLTLGTFAAVGLLYLPWILYVAPKLTRYVGDKVTSDGDAPLNVIRYVARHAVAFTGGHIVADEPALRWASWAGPTALILLAAGALLAWVGDRHNGQPKHDGVLREPSPYPALWTFMLVPLLFGFVLNLRLPFFPEGGERLLLIALPYLILLVAAAIDELWNFYFVGKAAAALLAVSCVAGIVTFYTTPRYVDHDYRPLIGQVVQQGRNGDTYFAVFPWQLGYWRAYVNSEPVANEISDGAETQSPSGPDPLLIADSAVEWGTEVSSALDAALDTGTVWFPAPLSFGSTLPPEIEAYLSEQSINLENRWISPATRLSAWRRMDEPIARPLSADFGDVKLDQAAVLPETAASDNSPLALTMAWQDGSAGLPLADADQDLCVTLRLRDDDGRVWASRDYAPLGSLSRPDSRSKTDGLVQENVGLIIPVGLAPGRYEVSIGVSVSGTNTLLYPAYSVAETDPLVSIGEVVVTQPATPQPVERLPIQYVLSPSEVHSGFAFLGFAGTDPDHAQLAGTDLELTLFLQNRNQAPPQRHLYLSILDSDDEGVGGWEGWSLPSYPTEIWPEGALVQVPVQLHVPAALADGAYELIVGLMDPNTGDKSPAVSLGDLSVKQRRADFSQPAMQTTMEIPVQFGTHADLIGYDSAIDVNEGKLYLTLHWHVDQTLLPPHHIFVHLDNEFGETIAQDDGPPVTATGRAPTGSWLPSEFVSTLHTVTLSEAMLPDGNLPKDIQLRVGIYNPDGNIRLPASIDGQPSGDATVLPVPAN